MAYNVSEAFREQCYSGESLYSCRLIIGENTIPISQIASITISSPIIDNNEETFYIGTFISQQLTIEFKNLDGIDTASGTNVELYISQNVNGTDIEVPIGKYLIDESPENYYQSAKIVCLDYAIKFSTNLDYSPAFVDNKITIDNLLQWICTHYGVTLGSYPSTNGNVEIGTYDSTVSGKRWISYIAEIKGCNAKMDRLGQLTLVPIKSSPAVTIDALKSASWELGEKYEISQVVFFDAIRNYTYGTDTENTLYLRQENPFIIDTNVVENVYNVVKDLQIWSLKCDNYGDISLDAWDIIEYTLGEETYYTYNNNTITYAMTIMSKIETKIPTKQQEVTTNVLGGNEEVQIRKLKTEVNTIENTITLQAQEIATIQTDISTPNQRASGKYIYIDNALDEPLVDFSLDGDTYQNTTSGKNMFNPMASYTTNSASITSRDADSITQKNSGTYSRTMWQINNLTVGQKYTLSCNYTNSNSCSLRVDIWNSTNDTQITASSVSTNASGSFTLTFEATETSHYVRLYSNTTGTSNSNSVVFSQIQFEKGSSKTSWEQFTNGVSPNPDYPQPIESVTGDNELIAVGKNLFDYTTSAFSNPSNVNITTVDNTITITTTTQTTSNNLFFYTRIPDEYLENGATYTISSENVSGVYRSLKLQLRNKNGSTASKPMVQSLSYDNNYALYIVENPFAESGSTTVPQGTTVVIKNVQVEKSSTASTYEAYQGISQEINLGKNLFDINQSEVSVLYATITINGNELTQKNSSTDAYSQSNWFIHNLIVGETYHVNCEFTNTNGCTLRLNMYDRNDTLINRTDNTTATSGTLSLTFVATDTTCKMRLYSNNTSTANSYSVIFNNIQLEKGSQETAYSNYFEPIKLNKIGDYQDYLFFNEESSPYYNIELQKNRWYLHKETSKVVLNGTETVERINTGVSGAYRFSISGPQDMKTNDSIVAYPAGLVMSDNFIEVSNTDSYSYAKQGILARSNNTTNFVICCDETKTYTYTEFKSWLVTHNTTVYYVLAEPTDIEITADNYEELYAQLNNLLQTPILRGINHIGIDTGNLQPNFNIEYVRDTALNDNFVKRPELNNYYTKTETTAQIQIDSASIKQDVAELQVTVDNDGNAISTLSNQVSTLQTSTDYLITVTNDIEQNGVTKVQTSMGYKFDNDGLNVSRSGSTINTLIDNNGLTVNENTSPILFAGYNTDTSKVEVRSPDLISERATIGKHRCETYTESSEAKTGWFYVG